MRINVHSWWERCGHFRLSTCGCHRTRKHQNNLIQVVKSIAEQYATCSGKRSCTCLLPLLLALPVVSSSWQQIKHSKTPQQTSHEHIYVCVVVTGVWVNWSAYQANSYKLAKSVSSENANNRRSEEFLQLTKADELAQTSSKDLGCSYMAACLCIGARVCVSVVRN